MKRFWIYENTGKGVAIADLVAATDTRSKAVEYATKRCAHDTWFEIFDTANGILTEITRRTITPYINDNRQFEISESIIEYIDLDKEA